MALSLVRLELRSSSGERLGEDCPAALGESRASESEESNPHLLLKLLLAKRFNGHLSPEGIRADGGEDLESPLGRVHQPPQSAQFGLIHHPPSLLFGRSAPSHFPLLYICTIGNPLGIRYC